MAILDIKNLSVQYGPVTAVQEIDLSVEEGKITALLGANGAGKSSTVNAIAGLVGHRADRMLFDNRDLSAMETEERVRQGVSLTPEGRRIFPSLTVKENMLLGGYTLRSQKARQEEQREKMLALFPILRDRQEQIAATLSGGQQQMLAIARSMMCCPQLLLLDEPSLGLAPRIVESIFDMLLALRGGGGCTLFIVEQNVAMVLDIADYVYVMASGSIRAQGTVEELNASGILQDAYLGSS